MNKEDIKVICNKFITKEKVEFIYHKNYTQKCEINKFGLSKIKNKESAGLFIRTINKKGQIGSQTITNISKENIKNAITKCNKIANIKNNIKIDDFGTYNSKRKLKCDKEIANLDLSLMLPILKNQITKDKYIKSYSGEITKSNNYELYLNPYTAKEIEDTNFSLYININTKDKIASSGGFSNIYTQASDVNIGDTVNQAKINANNLLNPKQGSKGEYTIIFVPEVTEEILDTLIVDATIGEDIYKKESYLHDLKNKQVFSKNLTIEEKAHLDYFLGSNYIDDEGFKTSNKKIIDKGVFKTDIYDQQHALIADKKPTGNGFRNSIYSSISCEHTNIIQKAGRKKIEDIITNTKKGIIVYGVMGLHTSNLTNGDFSLVINQGKEIKNGKLTNTITNLNFTGNCKEMFKNMEFSKEQKFFGDSVYSFTIIPNVKLI